MFIAQVWSTSLDALLLSSLTLYAFVIAWYISWYIRMFLCLIYKVKCKQLCIVWEALGSAYLLLLLSQSWISHCAKNIWSLLSIERFHFKASIQTKNIKQNNDNEQWIRIGSGFITRSSKDECSTGLKQSSSVYRSF